MPKAGAAAAQMCPGFQPRADIASYSFRAMTVLTTLRAKILGRAEEAGRETAMFTGRLLDLKQAPTTVISDAWKFSLGLLEVGAKPVKIEGDIQDVLGLSAVREIVEELGKEGVLGQHRVQIDPTAIEAVDEFTVAITVNVLV